MRKGEIVRCFLLPVDSRLLKGEGQAHVSSTRSALVLLMGTFTNPWFFVGLPSIDLIIPGPSHDCNESWGQGWEIAWRLDLSLIVDCLPSHLVAFPWNKRFLSLTCIVLVFSHQFSTIIANWWVPGVPCSLSNDESEELNPYHAASLLA